MTGSTLRILVVEDEAGVRLALVTLLRHFGHEVVGEEDPLKAIETFRNSSFDLVTVDFMMPGMNGLMLAQRLRDIRPNIRLILITAFPEGCNREELDAVGFQAIVAKPFRFHDITAAVEKCCNGSA